MVLTFIGYFMIAIGAAVILFGSLRAAFVLLFASVLLEGSAVIALPALGGSTIPPFQFALLFILVRILIPGGGYIGAVPEAIKENRWLLLFAFYGIASAFIGPRLFAGDINVVPMNFTNARGLYFTVPLQPGPQNITQAFYLTGSLLAALCSYIVCRMRGGGEVLVRTAIWTGWVHIALGLLAIAVRGTPIDTLVLDLFRNGNYAQLDAEAGGFVRIRGLFPEASTYASLAFSYFVLSAELWYRSIRPAATGRLAFAMAVILFFSTSSTAYVGLAAYLAFFILRLMVFPRLADMTKAMKLAMAMGALVFVAAILLAAVPDLPGQLFDMIERMTVGKSESDSGRQRLFWTTQGWWMFVESYGLGVGIGSFRSSSITTAMLGSVGAFGTICFLIYMFQVLQPWKKSTWSSWAIEERALGAALANAALLAMIPAALASSSAYPKAIVCILAGAALALRPVREVIYEEDADEMPPEEDYYEPVQVLRETAPPAE